MSKEKPILFSTPMVQAILAGNKTTTRRVIKCSADTCVKIIDDTCFKVKCKEITKQKYQVGDVLWVRETWLKTNKFSLHGDFIYKADGEKNINAFECFHVSEKWRPSIFMPREASRIFLEVTGVRCERLQDISEEDAEQEGISDASYCMGCGGCGGTDCYDPIGRYRDLWNTINAKRGYGWDTNPWVWVYEFRRVER